MRRAALCAGVVSLGLAWGAPLHALLPGPFTAHMTMHMLVVAVAAPLIALGVAGTRFDPVARAPRLFPPILLSLVELAVVWTWHAPALHRIARHTTTGVVVEQATFLLSGLLVWGASLGGDALRGGARTGGGLLALLLTSMHMTLLGALLALPPRPLYAHAHAHAHAGHALTPLQDQHLGGAIMLAVGGASYLLGGLALVAVFFRRVRA